MIMRILWKKSSWREKCNAVIACPMKTICHCISDAISKRRSRPSGRGSGILNDGIALNLHDGLELNQYWRKQRSALHLSAVLVFADIIIIFIVVEFDLALVDDLGEDIVQEALVCCRAKF